MARIKYLLLLVTIGVSLEHVYGEKHSPSKVPRPLNPSNQSKIGKRGIAETLIQQLSEKDHNDENTSVKYEVINSGQQDPIYGQQYETVSNPLESQVNKTQNYYGNQYSTLSNAPTLALSPPVLRQESANVLSHNIPPEPYNSNINPYPVGHNDPGLYVDTRQNQLSAQSEPLILSNAQTFYPPLFPNYQNYLINAPQYVAPTLPASPSPSLVSGNPIPINQNIQSVLPSLPTVPAGGQVFNFPSVANLEPQNVLSPLPTGLSLPLVSGNPIPINQNVQNVLPSLPIVPVGGQVFNLPSVANLEPQNVLPPLPASPSPSLVSGNPITINQYVQSVLPSLPTVPLGSQVYNLPSVANLEPQNLPQGVVQKPIQPIVTKDIYFHAAPPDYDEAPAVPVLPPKKTYKIIFIKLPSQESRNSAVLQNLYKNYAAREDKTLIYVLVKKPEEQPVIVPKTTPSQHEVLFVRYKENKLNPGNIISKEVEQKIDDSLTLKPGLPNGY